MSDIRRGSPGKQDFEAANISENEFAVNSACIMESQ
jgi:hypothetical protein